MTVVSSPIESSIDTIQYERFNSEVVLIPPPRVSDKIYAVKNSIQIQSHQGCEDLGKKSRRL